MPKGLAGILGVWRGESTYCDAVKSLKNLLVPTPLLGDSSNRAASTAFVAEAVVEAVFISGGVYVYD